VDFGKTIDRLTHAAEGTREWASGVASLPAALPSALAGPIPGSGAAAGSAAHSSPVEVELVERARAGDQDAFAALVRLHQRQVYLLALRMLHNEDDAVEATQDVFLAAWQGLRKFRGDARLATWLYRITYNHCLKVAEQRRREEQTRAELASESARAERPAALLSQVHAQNALRELCDVVRGEIARLPPKYRAVLALRHMQDLSYEEMAEVLREPIGTVKTHLFRARAILKERLAELDRAAAGPRSLAEEVGAGLYDLIGRRLEGLRKDGDR
jgi:RNA polymerase sigma-70 factor, ECF subfamily